jgi:hypothetical protein
MKIKGYIMQVSPRVGVFNNIYSATIKNHSLFDNVLNSMTEINHTSDVLGSSYKRNVVVTEYQNKMKFQQPTYIEVNSAALLSMKNSVQNRVMPIDIKRVNATLAYSA